MLSALTLWVGMTISALAADPILIGLNYPRTGHYKEEGLAQMRGALLAVDEINAQGGLLGREVSLLNRDTASRPDKAVKNVEKLVEEGAVMLFGSVSSAVAIAASERARELNTLYFATIGYSNDVTGKNGHRYVFRESTSATMTGRALGKYLSEKFPDKNYFYVTADYTWGHSSEQALRENTNTADSSKHKGVLLPFPTAKQSDYNSALKQAEESGAEVIALVLYGHDLVRAMRTAETMGLTKKVQIVAPNLTQSVIEQAGPGLMAGVIGTEHWLWRAPELENSQAGLAFVESFNKAYELYPPSAAASAYTVVKQWADAVNRSKSTNSETVIKALENHEYTLLKDAAQWRGFDHQNVQTVYVVQANDRNTVMAHPSRQDFLKILERFEASQAAQTEEQWQAERTKAGKPTRLQ